jgi:exonuclease VII small subunit
MEKVQKELEKAQTEIEKALKELENAKENVKKAQKEIQYANIRLMVDTQISIENDSEKIHTCSKESINEVQQINSETFMNFWNRPSNERLQISFENYEHAKKMTNYLKTDYEKYLEGLPISLKYSAILMGLTTVTIQSNETLYMNYLKQGFYMEDKYKMTYIVDINTLNL